MARCLGFGPLEGKCMNEAGSRWSKHWCPRCDIARLDHVSRRLADLNHRPVAECADCGMPYTSPRWIEAIIPDHVWNLIRPDGCGEGAGLLCISCMSGRLTAASLTDVPVWLCGVEPLVAHSGDPAEELKVLRKWKPDERD